MEDIFVPPNDDREHKHFRLKNGLSVLVISDKNADQASACITVDVGSMAQGKVYGLPHFLEHMLFMGTERYPEEKGFTTFLGENGGSYNGTTSKSHTNYYFSINKEKLNDALDRFSAFFICPLFLKDATDREMNAVNSEHNKNLQNDDYRAYHILSQQFTNHPFGTFTCGNLETLKIDGIHGMMLEFYKKHYSANRMALCIYGKESSQDLYALAEKYFSDIPNYERERLVYPPLSVPNGVPVIVESLGIKEDHVLTISWPVTKAELTEHKLMKSQTFHIISNLVGHEASGSILSMLKSKGYAFSLACGASSPGIGVTYINCYVTLTPLGLENTDEVISIIYAWIRKCEKNIPQYFIDEMGSTIENGWNSAVKSPVMEYTRTLSKSLADVEDPKDALKIRFYWNQFDTTKISQVFEEMTPENSIIVVTSPTFEGKTKQIDPYMKIPHTVTPVSADRIQKWKSYPACEKLHFPHKNPFIPTDFKLKNPQNSDKNIPQMIFDQQGVKAYFSPDTKYGTPHASVQILMETNQYGSVLSLVNWVIFKKSIKESLNEELLYFLHLTGVRYKLKLYTNNIQVQIFGYNDKILLAVEKIFKFLHTYSVTKEDFERSKQLAIRKFINNEFKDPYWVGIFNTSQHTCVTSFSNEDKVQTAQAVSYDSFVTSVKSCFHNINYVFLVGGNLLRSECQDFFTRFVSEIPRTPLSKSDIVVNRQYCMPAGEEHRVIKYLVDEDQTNSALVMSFECGPVTLRRVALINLLIPILHPEVFDQIRTKEQLGYIVFSFMSISSNVVYTRIIVQSNVKNPDYSQERVELYLPQFKESILKPYLENKENFTEYVKSVKSKLLVTKPNINQQFIKYLDDYNTYRDFNYTQKVVEELNNITAAELIEFYDNNILSQSKKLLTIHLYPKSSPLPNGKELAEKQSNLKIIDDYIQYRHSSQLYPTLQ